MHSNRQGFTIGICKIKVILADLGIFTHIPAYSGMAYSGITRAYLEPCVTLSDIEHLYRNSCHIKALSGDFQHMCGKINA